MEQQIKEFFNHYFAGTRNVDEWYVRVHPFFGLSPAELVAEGRGQEFLDFIQNLSRNGSR